MVYYFNIALPTRFNKDTWQQSANKPFKMSATLVKKEKLIGKTLQEVKGLLGQGMGERVDKNDGKGYLRYEVEGEWTLTVYLEKGVVVDAEMRLPFLGV